MNVKIAATLLLAGLLIAGIAIYVSQPARPVDQAPAPAGPVVAAASEAAAPAARERIDFSLPDIDGQVRKLSDWDGKGRLVNFWATWCAPCRLEMPGFEKLYRDKKDEGFIIVGVSADKTGRSGVLDFLHERDITYPVAMETRELELAFGGISAIPTSFLIDRQGVIRHRTFGFFPATGVRIAINRLLAEDSP